MKTLSKKIWKRWTVNARMNTGEEFYDGSARSFFFRSSAEKDCKALNVMRLAQGEKDWTYYVHDRQNGA